MKEPTNATDKPISADAGTGVEAAPPESRTEGAGATRPLPDDALIIVPVRNVVLFPGMVFPLTVGRERSRAAVYEAARLQRPLGVLLQSKPDADQPGPDELHRVGTTANVIRYITATDGAHHAICQGVQRFRVLQFLEDYPFMAARVELLAESGQAGPDIEGRAQGLKERAAEILQLLPQVPEEVVTALQGVEGAPRLADFIAGLMDIGAEEKQALLETFDLRTRLDKLLDLLAHRIEVLKVSREIAERTRGSIDDSQRKHLLREQMRTIQKELGEGDEGAAEIAGLERAIAAAGMPPEVEKQARKELKRLEREIGNVFRNVAVRVAEGGVQRVAAGSADVAAILGPRKFEAEVAMRSGVSGVATGLAWTPVGGDILFIEATRMPGAGKLILTGQLGEVMKESAQAALSLVKAHSRNLGIAPEALEKSDIHVHVPAGATPKDGPSAGVAIFVALASLLTGRLVRSDVAMTGEISLRGLVLPIGGVKEKVLAALRAGIGTVLLPARNRRDLEDIPTDAREKLKIVWVEHVDEAIAAALSPAAMEVAPV